METQNLSGFTQLLQKSKTLTQTDKVVKEQCQMSRSSESQGHNDACWWKGLELSNNVCDYEVNRLTYNKVIRGKRNFNGKC